MASRSTEHSAIADTLKKNRHQIAEIFANALSHSARWQPVLDKAQDNWSAFLEEEFYAYVDYLAQYYATGDSTFKHLYLGEKLKSSYDVSLIQADRKQIANCIHEAEKIALEQLLKPKLGEHLTILIDELSALHTLLITESTHKKHIVFVGDCLFLDIVPFVIGPLIDDDISIQVEYITSKNPLQVRDELKNLTGQKIDLIFFSPFTYEFCTHLMSILDWRRFFDSQQKITADLEPAWLETQNTIQIIADLFDCPIHVHNASFILREENVWKRFLKCHLTARVRHFAQGWLNTAITEYITHINQQSFEHVFMFDELHFVREIGDFAAGELLYNSKLQHPSVIGMLFAGKYVDIIYAHVIMAKKKLVVCDLDNTLWDGVIGEGDVVHYHARQQLLKSLKAKGIVLAINSKNDPKNVHWKNATLNEEDFVASAISWMPKVQGMSAIQAELNLKMNSFVFIDDRSDELELMRATYPEILCLNANEPKTWARFSCWLAALADDLEMDRTLMYKQREQRKALVKEDVTSEEDKLKLFAALDLKLDIKRPETVDLKRVAELINRTNQFNLAGIRVSLKEINDWYANDEYLMLTGRTSDRFGDMGVTCVAIGKLVNQQFELMVFVLSCRVFGYEFEHAVMNFIKRQATKMGAQEIKAQYIATAQNSPCKSFLAECGFSKTDEFYYYDLSKIADSDASWLTVIS